MRTQTTWLACLLSAGFALIPAATRGQDYSPPDSQLPLPLFHDRPENGGFFVAGEFMFFRQTNPLAHQLIARRGIVDFDGSITAALNGILIEPVPVGAQPGPPFVLPGQLRPGNFLGSGAPALFADDAGGPLTYTPGFKMTAGWRFENGFVLDISWFSLSEAKYAAGATLVPATGLPGDNLENTFLTSPVVSFPTEFAGAEFKLALGNPNAAFGVWNGASVMTIQFTQRFDQYEMTGRVPIFQTDNCRCYGLFGPRMVSLWENFRWRTVSEDFLGNATPADVAIYSNVVSNRLWGAHVGFGNEIRLGDTPAGTFSVSLDLQAAAMVDFVHAIAKYERGDFATASKRSLRTWTFAPELEAQANLWWFITEGIQLRVGYDVMGFFNTVASPSPVSFNYSNIDPPWEKGWFRLFDGFNAGIGLIF